MRITFVLPMFLTAPAGGFKVVYEYANRLQARGHDITVIHPRNVNPQQGWREAVKSYLWPYKLRRQNHPLIKWFPLAPEVNVQLVPDLSENNLPTADIIIATAFQTAFAVSECGREKGRKFYLIQHFEDWIGDTDLVRASWRLPMHKIVISRWLLDLAKELGESGNTSHIPNGLNFSEFYLTHPIEARCYPLVAMMAHTLTFKGTADGLTALRLLRERLPQVEAILFGVGARPADAPEWCEYAQLPTPSELREIYNKAAVFLFPSVSEGWGLPAMEAMACGCAVVAAENQGIRDFAQSGVNALLAPVRQPAVLADHLYQLLTNSELRTRLAVSAAESVRHFTWERAAQSLEDLLSNANQALLMKQASY
jgi:glycosyltransferase involved in cell wall biosynthesis